MENGKKKQEGKMCVTYAAQKQSQDSSISLDELGWKSLESKRFTQLAMIMDKIHLSPSY